MRERELKHTGNLSFDGHNLSLPMRERELKPRPYHSYGAHRGRSPCGSVN